MLKFFFSLFLFQEMPTEPEFNVKVRRALRTHGRSLEGILPWPEYVAFLQQHVLRGAVVSSEEEELIRAATTLLHLQGDVSDKMACEQCFA